MTKREWIEISYEEFLENPKSFSDLLDEKNLVLVDKDNNIRGRLGTVKLDGE